jgi:hypothetical protein
MRSALVVAAFIGGVLAGVGGLLAGLLEVQFSGAPQDTAPRLGYLATLAVGLAASVTAPLALWRRLLPASVPHWPIVAATGLATLAGALLLAAVAR